MNRQPNPLALPACLRAAAMAFGVTVATLTSRAAIDGAPPGVPVS